MNEEFEVTSNAAKRREAAHVAAVLSKGRFGLVREADDQVAAETPHSGGGA